MKKELIKEEETDVIPDYLVDCGPDGADDIQGDMLTSSYIKLVQKTSKEFDDGSAKLGEFIDSITGEIWGVSFNGVVIKMATIWKKFDESNNLVAVSENGTVWDDGVSLSKEEKWKTCFFEFYVIPLKNFNNIERPIPNIVSFSGASFKGGKQLHNIISRFVQLKSEPIYARNYEFYSEEKQGEKGKYSELKTRVNSGFNSKDIVLKCSQSRQMIENITFNNDEKKDGDDDFYSPDTPPPIESIPSHEKSVADLD